jgi:hypothetical protein
MYLSATQFSPSLVLSQGEGSLGERSKRNASDENALTARGKL